MRKKAHNYNKLNDAGMTLIEVLVAMFILAIAIVPLMFGYVHSAKNSNKARDLQQTSVLANTVIENCKAYTVTQIDQMVTSGNITLPDGTMRTVEFVDNATAKYKSSSVPAGEYLYHFDNVNMYDDGSGNTSNQIYDVSVAMKPYGAESDLMLYEDMNPYKDALFMAGSTLSESAPPRTAEYLESIAYEYAVETMADYIEDDAFIVYNVSMDVDPSAVDNSLRYSTENAGILEIERTIEVTAEVAGGCEVSYVTYKYDFVVTQDYVYQVNVPGTGDVTKSVNVNYIPSLDITFKIYDNSNTQANGARLENIYLFYYPPYNNLGINFTQDVININNNLDRDLNVYVMKQMRNDMSEAEISVKEATYDPDIIGNVSDPTLSIFLYHNLNQNIGGGATTGWGPTGVLLPVKPVDTLPASAGEALIKKDSKQLMYEVIVTVYPKDAYDVTTGSMSGDALATLDGTFLNW